uniref:V-type proton ATPase subunit a n=1 Tax=Panagrellus redivivus TaxID=6233 RepID=A0A7E4W8R9_PANRE
MRAGKAAGESEWCWSAILKPTMDTPKRLQTKKTAETLLEREKQIYNAFGTTITEFFLTIRDACIEAICSANDQKICPRAVDPAAPAHVQKAFATKVLEGIFKSGSINYLITKVKKTAIDTVFKIPSYVTLTADEPHRIAAKKNDEDQLDAEIEALTERIVMLRSQTKCVDDEQANIDALLEIGRKCLEESENTAPVNVGGLVADGISMES